MYLSPIHVTVRGAGGSTTMTGGQYRRPSIAFTLSLSFSRTEPVFCTASTSAMLNHAFWTLHGAKDRQGTMSQQTLKLKIPKARCCSVIFEQAPTRLLAQNNLQEAATTPSSGKQNIYCTLHPMSISTFNDRCSQAQPGIPLSPISALSCNLHTNCGHELEVLA
jgi:hypothetical protein